MTSDTGVWTNAAVYEDALTWKCDDLDDEQLDMKMIWLWYGRVCCGHGDVAAVDLNWFVLIEQQRLNKMIDAGSNVMNRLIWCVCTAVRKNDCMMLAAIWWTEWCIRGYGQNDMPVDMDRMMMNNWW